MRSTLDDSVDGAVLSGAANILVLSFPVIIHEEMLINDGVNVGVSRGFNRWSGKVRFMLSGINGEGAKELLGLVEGFLDGEGSFDPVDRGVDFFQPRES